MINRRDFLKTAGVIAPLCLLNPFSLAQVPPSKINSSTRLSLRANRGSRLEGQYTLSDIEGHLPDDITGILYRIGPGQRKNYDVNLNHFFDGDPLLTSFEFKSSGVIMNSRYLKTPERLDEINNQKMLYHEFGTKVTGRAKGFKYQPNVNLLYLNQQQGLLALSESGHPFSIASESYWDFDGTLPKDVSFTAHPKRDPLTNEIFSYGIEKSLGLNLKVFKMNPQSGRLVELYSISQDKAFVIHDMMLTENYIVFVIAPLYLDLWDMIQGRAPLAAALRYDPRMKARVLILHKSGRARPIEVEMPSLMIFHHGNAYELNQNIIFDSCVAKDNSILQFMANWQGALPNDIQPSQLTRFEVDLNSRQIKSRTDFNIKCDFPVFNLNKSGQPLKYLYFAEQRNASDPLASTHISKFDFTSHKLLTAESRENEIYGEPYFLPRANEASEDDGWCIYMGYNADRDETFVQIIDGIDLKQVCRIWAGHYLPLGFHGTFV